MEGCRENWWKEVFAVSEPAFPLRQKWRVVVKARSLEDWDNVELKMELLVEI